MTSVPTTLELTYHLQDLPSIFHRVGLAGLFMVLRHLPEPFGIAEIVRQSSQEARLVLDKAGLAFLLDHIYSSSKVTRRFSSRPMGEGTIVREEVEEHGGKRRKFWWVEQYLPTGSFHANLEKVPTGEEGSWIRMWRIFMRSIVRPGQRALVFKKRLPLAARATQQAEIQAMWKTLIKNTSLEQTGAFMLGAQNESSERTPFLDTARNQLLLHFWPYAIFLFNRRETEIDIRSGNEKFSYLPPVVALPDLYTLDFCDHYEELVLGSALHHEGRLMTIDLLEEAGLRISQLFRNHRVKHGRKEWFADSVELFEFRAGQHGAELHRQIRMPLRSGHEVDLPSPDLSPTFRQSVIQNYIGSRPWFHRMDVLLDRLPPSFFYHHPYFFGIAMRKHLMDIADTVSPGEPLPLAVLIQRIVRRKLYIRLDSKFGLRLEEGEGRDNKAFNAKAHEESARLTVELRSQRTDRTFRTYFSETYLSQHQPSLNLPPANFTALTEALEHRPDVVRALTFCALSSI